jgi:hypothetical protein
MTFCLLIRVAIEQAIESTGTYGGGCYTLALVSLPRTGLFATAESLDCTGNESSLCSLRPFALRLRPAATS